MSDNGDPTFSPGTVARPVIKRFDPKKSFETTSAVDRAKAYLKKIPVYDAQMKALIDDFTAIRERFNKLAGDIGETVKEMEKEGGNG